MELLVENVQKCYAKVTAIKKLSFKVKQGEIFALLGPNGAGKIFISKNAYWVYLS